MHPFQTEDARLHSIHDKVLAGQRLSSDDALAIQRAFRRFAPRKLRRHIDDVMRTQKNAVLLWTVTPPTEEMNKVFGCLKG